MRNGYLPFAMLDSASGYSSTATLLIDFFNW